ncbi:prephenate-dependent tRNA uridine(34) hydroxylase TrhP [Marinobacterium arenosum]|uniref:prephenate-dependent tRNA uridine(34) hydroxylase TrhP n=1 Tax=Marinobacterium arenosum TaxID=2862496 RepID=UPI001C95F468|nr:tRNA 5-hydroxyuridine modification protein YegQ [Marinobacterium arenosum]MBY4678621.1 tRNA 5-hydroxyuridine modification protein YegQ [Marinobacterium arenosum]
MRIPELLSPAGTLKNMKYAFAYGADAVYAGQPRYSLRVRNNDFNMDNLAQGIDLAHQLGKKFYVASNIMPHNSKLKTYLDDMRPVVEMGPDALIMSDPGLIMMVKEAFPEVPVHLSVQANTMNWASVKFWHKAGIERVILSRELSLDEVAEIRQLCPEMEIEVFVHGSLCIAYSGRCLLSGYINKRDPNQGTCTNACRWKYDAHEAKEGDNGDLIPLQQQSGGDAQQFDPTTDLGLGDPTDKVYLLQEESRPGEYMPAFEDEHGTYIMNSKDLRAIQHVHRLAEMGVDSLKIEGRTKSHYYVARTAQAYRKAIDDAAAGKPFDMQLMDTLENLANRGYTEGFYRRHVHDEYQNYETGNSVGVHQQFVGEVLGRDGDMIEIDVRNRFEVGDTLELMTPQGNQRFKLDQLINKKGESTDAAPGSGHRVRFKLEVPGELEYALLMRDLPNAPARD